MSDREYLGDWAAPRTRREFAKVGVAGAIGLWLPFSGNAVAARLREGSAHARIGPRAIADLQRRLRGTVLLPSDPAFDSSSQPFNARFDHIVPKLVAQVANERDVAQCIDWAREHEIAPVARGGGHSYAGFSTNRGLVIDLGRLNRVVVDARKGTAVVGGAALNANALAATKGGEWVLPGGTCLGVAYGGLTLGGGIGFNAHWAGLSCDHLLSTRMVTAEGKRIEVSKSAHPDLFWASRGGAGGNFGINTTMKFRLAKIPVQQVAFYSYHWQGADAAAAVFAAFDKLCETAPPEFNADTAAQATPIGPGGPRAAIEVFSRGQFLGSVDELRELVRPLELAAPTTSMQLETFDYWDMQQMFASAEQPRHSWGDISRYAQGALPDGVYGQLAELIAQCPTRTADTNGSFWSLGWVGGSVVNSIGRRETAYVHRNVSTLLRATPDWADDAPASVSDGLQAWARQMIALIKPHTPNESYQNFPNRGLKDWKRQYYGENYRRLRDVKTKYDPDNVFRNAQSIPPRKRSARS
jgi:FAD/FMN-containing dehydrogenase